MTAKADDPKKKPAAGNDPADTPPTDPEATPPMPPEVAAQPKAATPPPDPSLTTVVDKKTGTITATFQ